MDADPLGLDPALRTASATPTPRYAFPARRYPAASGLDRRGRGRRAPPRTAASTAATGPPGMPPGARAAARPPPGAGAPPPRCPRRAPSSTSSEPLAPTKQRTTARVAERRLGPLAGDRNVAAVMGAAPAARRTRSPPGAPRRCPPGRRGARRRCSRTGSRPTVPAADPSSPRTSSAATNAGVATTTASASKGSPERSHPRTCDGPRGSTERTRTPVRTRWAPIASTSARGRARHRRGRRTNIGPASPAALERRLAPRIRLPNARSHRSSSGNVEPNVEPVDVAREQPAEERPDEPLGRLVPQPAAEQRAERLVGRSVPRLAHQVAERAQPAAGARGRASGGGPPPIAGDAERARRERLEPAIGPREGVVRAGSASSRPSSRQRSAAHGLRATNESGPASSSRPPTVAVRSRPPTSVLGLQHGDVERRVRPRAGGARPRAPRRLPRRRRRDGPRASIVLEAASRSRTTSASTPTNAGSAFGISVRDQAHTGLLGRSTSPRRRGRTGSRGGRPRTRPSTRPRPDTLGDARSASTSSMGGPHQGSAVRPALCHAIVWRGRSSSAATRSAVSWPGPRGSGTRPRRRGIAGTGATRPGPSGSGGCAPRRSPSRPARPRRHQPAEGIRHPLRQERRRTAGDRGTSGRTRTRAGPRPPPRSRGRGSPRPTSPTSAAPSRSRSRVRSRPRASDRSSRR